MRTFINLALGVWVECVVALLAMTAVVTAFAQESATRTDTAVPETALDESPTLSDGTTGFESGQLYRQVIQRGAEKFSLANKTDDLDLWSVDPLVKVFRDASPNSAVPPAMDVARGEDVSLQVVFRSTRPVTGLKARMSKPFVLSSTEQLTETGQLTGTEQPHEIKNVRLRFVGYVPVNRPTQWRDGSQLRPTPAMYPDPLLTDGSIDVVEGHAQPIWISAKIPTSAVAGDYHGEIEVLGSAEGDEFVGVLPLTIRVHDVTVGQSRMWSSCWFGPQLKKMGIEADAFSPEYWAMLRKIAKNLAEHRQNVAKVSPQNLGQFSVTENGELQIDFSRFDQTVQLFIDEGLIGRIEGDPIGKRISGWDTPFIVNIRRVVDGEIVEETAKPDSAEADQYCRWYLTTLTKHLEEKGWADIYLQHLGDEPTSNTRESYYQLAQLSRKYSPKLKTIEATHTHALPDDALDVWMPLLSTLADNYEGFKKRREAGAELWTYTCLHPQGGWANRFIEQPLLKPRLLSWINFKYGIAGHLNWGYNSWRSDDPFTELTPKGGPGYLPAGDAWMVYPSPEGPIDSIRYEAWRDGSADYELLSMLAEKNPDLAQQIAANHILSFKKYNINVEAFRDSRRQLLSVLGRSE